MSKDKKKIIEKVKEAIAPKDSIPVGLKVDAPKVNIKQEKNDA